MTKSILGKTTRTEDTIYEHKCFVIMPFGGWLDTYYFDIYMPAIKAAGFEPQRADDLYGSRPIINDIWNSTKEANVILADLTKKNPNVFYELGLAHAIAKPTILITATMKDVPFDLKHLRIIEYDKNFPKWSEILQEKITKSLKEILKKPEQTILPILSISS